VYETWATRVWAEALATITIHGTRQVVIRFMRFPQQCNT